MLSMTSGVKRKEPPSNFSEEGNFQSTKSSSFKKPCVPTSQGANNLTGHTDMETDQYFCQRMLPNLPIQKEDESDLNCSVNNNNYFHCNLNNNNYLPPRQQCTRCLAGEAGHFNHLS